MIYILAALIAVVSASLVCSVWTLHESIQTRRTVLRLTKGLRL